MAKNKETNKQIFKFLEGFLNKDSISGFEHEVAEHYKEIAKKSGAEVTRGGLGSVVAKLGNKGPKIMIASHMDEVGWVVQRIEKNGFLRMSPVGGIWNHTVVANKVKVVNSKGEEFFGTIGSTSVHVLPIEERNKVMPVSKLFIDLGFDKEDDVRKAGIDAGDKVIRIQEATLLADGDKFMGKGLDNRYGLAILAKVVERLKDESHPNTVYAVGTVQEEVGLRGARAISTRIDADITIALDTTVSHDTPGIIPGDTKLGKGVAITMKDNSAIGNPMLANMLFDLAKKKKIPAYKWVSQGGGNDAGETQFVIGGGAPTVSLSIPTRYLHTTNEIGSIKDFNAFVELLVEFIKMFDKKELNKVVYK